MSKIVQVEGLGNVEFPDAMSDAEIGAQISKSMAPKDPEAKRKAAIERGIEAQPWPMRMVLKAGGEIDKAVREPKKYIREGIDPDTGKPNVVQSAVRGGVQGLTFGFGDEMAAAMTPGVPYAEERDRLRAKNAAARVENPKTYLGGTLAGGLAAPLPGGALKAGLSTTAKVLRGAGSGALGGGLYGAGASEGGVAETVGDAAKGAMLGAGLGGGLSAVGAGLSGLASRLPQALRRFSGERNLKAAGGIQSDLARARKQVGREGLNEVGYDMGAQGLVGATSTPASTFEKATEALDSAWGEMGGLVQAADQRLAGSPGLKTRLGQVVAKAQDEILAPLKADPFQPEAANAFESLLGRMTAGEKQPGWKGLSLSDLHVMRKQADKAIYGMKGNKDPGATTYSDALHDFRTLLSTEIDDVMNRTGIGQAAWKSANRKYQVAATAQTFAEKGMDRAHGNNLFSPMEVGAGLMGAGASGAHSGNVGAASIAGAAGLIGMRLARRHGSGALGSLARVGSEATAPLATPAGQAATARLGNQISDLGPKELMALGLLPGASDDQDAVARAAATIEALRRRAEGR